MTDYLTSDQYAAAVAAARPKPYDGPNARDMTPEQADAALRQIKADVAEREADAHNRSAYEAIIARFKAEDAEAERLQSAAAEREAAQRAALVRARESGR